MLTEVDEWGPRLYAYIEAHVTALGLTINAWTERTPLVSGGNVSRWKTGETTPRLPAMRHVADALGVTLVDVLLAVGIIGPEECEGRTAVTPPVPSVEVAIDNDPTVSDFRRMHLRDINAALKAVESGEVRKVAARRAGVRSKPPKGVT